MDALDELCTAPGSLPAEPRYRQLLEKLHSLDELMSAPEFGPTPKQLQKLLPWLLSILQPSPELLPPEQVLEDDIISPPPCLDVFQDVSKLTLAILSKLLQKYPPSRELAPDLAVALVAHSDPADPWTTPDSRKSALDILAAHNTLLITPEILTTKILVGIVKTHFSAGGPSTAHRNLTADGRKALRPSTNKSLALLPSSPPWRHDHPETTTLLHWTIRTLDSSQFEPSWHLLVPPILTLLDDYYPPSKTRGCAILTTLLQRLEEQKLPRGGKSLLTRTGLGPVMWDAVIPCLLALPPLTPQSHSIPLLHAAYETLLALSRSMTATHKDRAKLLDKVLRNGIINGMRFAGENVFVAQTLIQELSGLVEEMGIWAARHLKEVVPLLADVLGSPFGTTFVPLLVAAARTLGVVVRVCWVRIAAYGVEVLRGVTVCWRRVVEEEEEKGGSVGEGLAGVKEELRGVVRVLRAAVEGDEDSAEGRIAALEKDIVGADPRLAGLFEV